jgi:hypothetical protein
MLSLQMVSLDRALIEAWVETDHGCRPVRAARLVAVESLRDGSMQHIDIEDADVAASISLVMDESSGAVEQLVYARTPLLEEVGFLAGTCDAPMLRR